MLGSTADSLFWMFRYLERTENIIYLIETGFQLNLISSENYNEWNSILKTTGTYNLLKNKKYTNIKIVNFMLRDKKNPNNILTLISKAFLDLLPIISKYLYIIWPPYHLYGQLQILQYILIILVFYLNVDLLFL